MKGKKMTLNDSMNFIDIGRWIMQEQKAKKSREDISERMIKKFGWSQNQANAATDPYYDEKLFTTNATKVRRR